MLSEGDALECEAGVEGGEPRIDGTHSIFSGDGDLLFKFSFSCSSLSSIFTFFTSGDFFILRSSGADEDSLTEGVSFNLLADFSTSASWGIAFVLSA